MTDRRTVLMMGAAVCASVGIVWGAAPGAYFTNVNIWYEHPEKIYSTNYHAGKIMAAGSEVEVISIKRGKVRFKLKGQETVYLYTYVKKHSSLSFDDEFARVFSSQNTYAETAKKFTGAEKNAVQKGEVVEGMSREAVLASYGYPPSHVTQDLDVDHWTYWVKRMTTKSVTFKDGKVYTIQ